MSQVQEATNWEVFLWALYRLGGATEFIEVEDVFLRCFELAPNRFSWRTRENLPDYKKCSKALRDAEAKKPRFLVKTGDGFKRQLTVEGQEWVEANERRLEGLLESGRVVQEPKQRPRSRYLTEVERSEPFLTWLSRQVVPDEKWRVAELMRCSPDSDSRVWENRLQVLRSAAHAADKKEMLDFLDEVVRLHPEWFQGGKVWR